MTISLEESAETLAGNAVGQRLWFWLCPDAEPMLLVTTLADDPVMASLYAAAQAARPADAAQTSGLAHRGEDGRLRLMAAGFPDGALSALACWVKKHGRGNPGLLTLADPVLLTVEDGEVIESERDAALWSWCPSTLIPGSAAAAAAALLALPAGRRAWFWTADVGEGAVLVCTPVEGDEDSEAFQRAVEGLLRRASSVVRPIKGVFHRGEDGRLTVFSDRPAAQIAARCADLVAQHPALGELTGALIAQLGEEGLADAINQPVANLSALSADLNGMNGDARWFCFSAGAGLMLAADRADLKRRLTEQQIPTDALIRGRVQASSKGWLEFMVRKSEPDFLAALAGWATPRGGQWPALRRLKGARASVRGTDNNTTVRYRDDRLWQIMPAAR
ncbi:MAG: hypothetical protein ACI8RZ_005123 [Myxococcota bacterium]|jgi:hypothetical protein